MLPPPGAWEVDIDTMNRTRRETLLPREDVPVKERGAVPLDAARPSGIAARRAIGADAELFSGPLLRNAAREAGLFQRSVLGHLDHKDWVNRVRADGQHLIDLLSEMGFSPSDGRAKLTQ